ncbi:alpha/beta fold hydrolase [Sphingomonas koreensis]|nr:alpha/beta hydrolase family protein [Sphingomonas koreensis]RSU60232.1 alpha/beta fold hydrolase [Sphingomonas koreensis]RSU65067.1 alpha/beta fold hydrolase [Sphingomonas koreensis]
MRHMAKRSGLAALALMLAMPATSPAQTPAPAQVTSSTDVIYATHPTGPLHLDLHRPAGKGRAPVLVVLHGGGWARGERPKSWAGLRPFVEAGYAIVSVQYRLSGTAQAPAAVQDARCAMAWVARNADRHQLDPRRLVVLGTSAGGHLALMAGMLGGRADIDLPACGPVPRAAAIIDFYGPTDLRPESLGKWRSPSVTKWIGEGPDAPALAERMSPLTLVRKGQVPVFIVHGDADNVVPIQSSRQLKAALDRAGVPSELHIVPGGGHGKLGEEAQARLYADALRFLERHRITR